MEESALYRLCITCAQQRERLSDRSEIRKITLVKLDAFLEWDLMTPRNAERISLDALAIDRGAINQKQRFIPL
jgi:hypothetical protein